MSSQRRQIATLLGLCVIGLVLVQCTTQTAPDKNTLPATGTIRTNQATEPAVTGNTTPRVTMMATAITGGETAAPGATTTTTPTLPATPIPGYDDVPMVEVPAGEFLMGSVAEDIVRWEKMQVLIGGAYSDYVNDEWPQMTVYLDTFEIDQYEVTSARYQRCVDAGRCSPPRHPADGPEHPVLVGQKDAQAYCQWVDKRLPTEAEWEKAARGSDGRIYPWGDEWDPARLQIHYGENGFETTPVGSYPEGASPYGALDMAGNAPEWVDSLYRVYPGGRFTETSLWIQGMFVQRGGYHGPVGSKDPPELHYRTADRFPHSEGDLGGFRCVHGPEPSNLEKAIVSTTILSPPSPLSSVDLTKMAEIPAGEFQMGSGSDPVYPLHTVYLDTYYIDRYETTNAEYVEFLNELGATFFACNGLTCAELKPNDPYGSYYRSNIFEKDGQFLVETGYENYPVTSVTWEGADAYCRWRGKRLPTEAEWEKAARGIEGWIYSWGDQRGTNDFADKKPSSVGSFPQDVSFYGVWDMTGNVYEWVSDWHDPNYYFSSPYHNPRGPERPVEPFRRIARPGLDRKLFSHILDSPDYARKKGVRCAYTP